MGCRIFFLLVVVPALSYGQLPVARDTICVLEQGKVLAMPWSNGLNYANLSNLDVNGDGLSDLVLFDRYNQFSVGRFRCFIKEGTGTLKYRAAPELSYLFPTTVNWAVFKDYDCDSRPDLFCSTPAGIRVYRNETTPGQLLAFRQVKSLLYTDYNPGGTPVPGNLYASSQGVPGIADVDGDGDLDVLTFAPQGVFVEFHRNMSIERFNSCDSLQFQMENYCWGNLAESSCTVSLAQCGNERTTDVYHAGSCLSCLDSDSDLDLDLIMGDITCNNLQYAHNTGSPLNADFTDTTSLYPNFPLKNSTKRAQLNNFPCAYVVDADVDGKNDLVVTPNAFLSENYKSVWLYRNTSATGTVNFQFVKDNFLQDEMIEVGQNSFPVLFDYDVDGRKDLLIGSYGYYGGQGLKASLTLYRNTGSPTVPQFSLITRDYASLSTYSLSYALPAVGDLDNDGDVDICIGTSGGQVHWLENTAGAGKVCNFSVFKNNPFGFTTPSGVAAPQLFDIDSDGDMDLLIGMLNGRVAYYRNTTGGSAPVFSLVTASFGGIDVRGDVNYYSLEGYAAPHFYMEGGKLMVLVGSVSGAIFQYQAGTDLSKPFQLIDQSVNGLFEGGQSTPWYQDINGDGGRDLVVGNASGGLSFFSSASHAVGLGSEASLNKISVYPNPANTVVNMVNLSSAVSFRLLNGAGSEVGSGKLFPGQAQVAIDHLPLGLYFIILKNQSGEITTARIIKTP